MTDPTTLADGFEGLVQILAALRAPDGCPWDREQSHESLLRYLVEEAAEVVEAVKSGDREHLAEELGDVLLQVVFHAQIGRDEGTFTIDDVIRAISQKMIRRHPHVFGTANADTAHQVKVQWDVIKQAEKAAKGQPTTASVLDKIPKSLPALARAQKLQERAARAGFAWPSPEAALAKVDEEWSEWRAELASGDRRRAAEELGDLLFAVASAAREFGFDAETELLAGNAKFEERFRRLERQAGGAEALKALPTQELLSRWDRLKAEQTPDEAAR